MSSFWPQKHLYSIFGFVKLLRYWTFCFLFRTFSVQKNFCFSQTMNCSKYILRLLKTNINLCNLQLNHSNQIKSKYRQISLFDFAIFTLKNKKNAVQRVLVYPLKNDALPTCIYQLSEIFERKSFLPLKAYISWMREKFD